MHSRVCVWHWAGRPSFFEVLGRPLARQNGIDLGITSKQYRRVLDIMSSCIWELERLSLIWALRKKRNQSIGLWPESSWKSPRPSLILHYEVSAMWHCHGSGQWIYKEIRRKPRTWTNVSRTLNVLSWKFISLSTVYRVHWLKAKARRDRWTEEFNLLSSEMDWTVSYYQYQASCWQQRADVIRQGDDICPDDNSDDRSKRGKICYAMKQKRMWNTMAERAVIVFEQSKRKVGLTWKYIVLNTMVLWTIESTLHLHP